jgi:FAD synthetase
MKKVLVFGSFDLIHPGHHYFFEKAKSYGSYLIVVLAHDKTIKEVKGKKPLYDLYERKKQLEKIDIIDEVIIGSLNDKYQAIKKFKPDVICLGHDQFTFVDNLRTFLKKEKLESKVVRLKPYKRDKYSSSIYKKNLTGEIRMDLGNEIGRVVEFYKKKMIVVIELTQGIINKDDVLVFQNVDSVVESKILSMQIEKKEVNSAKVSDVVGIKVEQEVKLNDIVSKKNKKMVKKL